MYRRSITYRLIAGFMALWMLVVSMGATVDMHFCRGHLVDYKIWGKARTCGMKEDASACNHSSQGISHPKCCDQATHQLYFDQTNVGAQNSSVSTLTHQEQVAMVPVFIPNWDQREISRPLPDLPLHGPPWQERDRTILFSCILC